MQRKRGSSSQVLNMEEQSSPQLTPETPLEPTDSAETNISRSADSRQEDNFTEAAQEGVNTNVDYVPINQTDNAFRSQLESNNINNGGNENGTAE